MNDANRAAELLHRLRIAAGMRRERAHLSVGTAEALCWIAAGVDNLPDLAVAMGTPGRPADDAMVSRTVSALRGRDRWDGRRWIEAPFCLVATRKHPHRQGLLLSLTPAGERILQIDH